MDSCDWLTSPHYSLIEGSENSASFFFFFISTWKHLLSNCIIDSCHRWVLWHPNNSCAKLLPWNLFLFLVVEIRRTWEQRLLGQRLLTQKEVLAFCLWPLSNREKKKTQEISIVSGISLFVIIFLSFLL